MQLPNTGQKGGASYNKASRHGGGASWGPTGTGILTTTHTPQLGPPFLFCKEVGAAP